MGMIMTYPTIDSFRDSGIRDRNDGNMLEVIRGCIMQIYEEEGKKVYKPKEQTKNELTDVIEPVSTKK